MSRNQASWQTQQENTMRVDSTLQKLEVYVVAAVAVLLVSGIAFFLSSPFYPQDYGLADVSTQNSPTTSSAASQDFQPALLEPALRSPDGAPYYG
jgi:hypothetical protein